MSFVKSLAVKIANQFKTAYKPVKAAPKSPSRVDAVNKTAFGADKPNYNVTADNDERLITCFDKLRNNEFVVNPGFTMEENGLDELDLMELGLYIETEFGTNYQFVVGMHETYLDVLDNIGNPPERSMLQGETLNRTQQAPVNQSATVKRPANLNFTFKDEAVKLAKAMQGAYGSISDVTTDGLVIMLDGIFSQFDLTDKLFPSLLLQYLVRNVDNPQCGVTVFAAEIDRTRFLDLVCETLGYTRAIQNAYPPQVPDKHPALDREAFLEVGGRAVLDHAINS